MGTNCQGTLYWIDLGHDVDWHHHARSPVLVYTHDAIPGIRPAPFFGTVGVDLFFHFREIFETWRWKKFTAMRHREIRQKQRDAKYRNRRVKDPKLPKNW